MSDGLETLRANWKILIAIVIVSVAWGEMRWRVNALEGNKSWNLNQTREIKILDQRVTRLEARLDYGSQ